MKFLAKKKSVALKILIILLVSLILIFAVTPNYYNVHAAEESTEESTTEVIEEEDMPDEGEGIIGSLLKQILQIFAQAFYFVISLVGSFCQLV